MPDIAQERFELNFSRWFSGKICAVTFGILLAASAITAGVIIATASPEDTSTSVTVSFKGEQAAPNADAAEGQHTPITAGALNEEDATAPVPVNPHENPAETHSEISPAPAGEISVGEKNPALPADAMPDSPAESTRPVAIEDAVAGLHESSPFGMLPIVRKSDGLTAYEAYQAPFTAKADTRAIISLVMTDYGLSQNTSVKASSSLPGSVTFALSAYARDAQNLTTQARKAGHEVWIGLPVQTARFGDDDPGNQTILAGASDATNKNRLLTTLGKATGYAGVISLDSGDFSGNNSILDAVYGMIAERGLALAQANPKDTVTAQFAVGRKTPFIQNDIWLDQRGPENLKAELERLRKLALEGQIAVGFFTPAPATLKTLAEWQSSLAGDKIELAPLSFAIEKKTR